MKRTHSPIIGGACSFLTLVALLVTPACQGLNALVTGDNFYVAKEGTPRVELELQVELEDSLSETFEGIHQMEEWNGALSARVLSLADLGMRFYPILAQAYAPDNPRPVYRMLVRIEVLRANFREDLIEEKGLMPRVEYWVESIDCTVSSSLERRRANGPPLIVGHSEGRGRVRLSRNREGLSAETSYSALPETEEVNSMSVAEEDVLEAVEEAIISALRGLVRSVDRDFALDS